MGKNSLYNSITVAAATWLAMAGVPAAAQTYGSLTVFGESYADRGNVSYFRSVCGTCTAGIPASALANYPRSTPFPSNPPVDATQIVTFSYKLQQLLGIPDARVSDYAISGATAYSGFGGLGETRQVDTFLARGGRFGPNDLVAAQFIGNDGINSALITNGLAPVSAFDTGNPVLDARTEAGRDISNIQRLVGAGMRTLVLLGPGDVTLKPIGQTGLLTTPGFQVNLRQYYNTAFDAVQSGLVPYSQSGLRVFLFDLRVLEQRLNATPQIYGFATLGQAFRLAQGDGLHYTQDGFNLIGRYIQNQMDAVATVGPQADVVVSIADSFAQATLNRIDAFRSFTPLALGAGPGVPAPVAPGTVSTFVEGNYTRSDRDARFLNGGHGEDAGGVTVGAEYQATPNLRLGVAFGYAHPQVHLGVQDARLDVDSYQIGAYGTFTTSNWFADGMVAYGRQNLTLTRSGILDTIRSTPSGDSVVAAARGGYLFDAGPVRLGPIVGLDYTRGSIGAYSESGDVLVTQSVGGQTRDGLVGSAGLQLRLPVVQPGAIYSPFLNLTAEHDLRGSGRTIRTTQATTPLLPVYTPVASDGRTYGKVAGGVTLQLARSVGVTANAWTTFERDRGNDVGLNAGVRLSF